jgi:hypothetical protein
MALIALLLGIKSKSLQRFAGGFEPEKQEIYSQPRSLGLHCANSNCIVHDPMEAQYVRNKFSIVRSTSTTRLRCVYCEREIEQFVVASKKNKWYAADPAALLRADHGLKDTVLFADEADAQAAGFHSRRSAAEPRPKRRAAGRSK